MDSIKGQVNQYSPQVMRNRKTGLVEVVVDLRDHQERRKRTRKEDDYN